MAGRFPNDYLGSCNFCYGIQTISLLVADFFPTIISFFDHRLGRLQDSNAVLSHFNEYSENCYAEVSVDLAKNTRVLKSMKADLDYIFQKLRYASASSLVSLLTSYLFVPFKLLE